MSAGQGRFPCPRRRPPRRRRAATEDLRPVVISPGAQLCRRPATALRLVLCTQSRSNDLNQDSAKKCRDRAKWNYGGERRTMKTSLLILSVLALPLFSVHADSKADVTGAIKKLAAQSGYAWTYTPKTEGSESGRRQGPIEGKTEKDGYTHLKSSLGDVTLEIGIKGTKMVVNYNGDWLSTAELGENNRTVQRLRMLKKADEEASDLVEQATDLKKDADGSYSSSMAGEAAKSMFSLLGKRAAESPEAKGSMKF